MRAPLVACAALLLLVGAPPGAPAGRGPALTRDQMEAALTGPGDWRFVYGTLDPAFTPTLRRQALAVAIRLFGGDSTQVLPDREVSGAEFTAHAVFLFGGPGENDWTRRLAAELPVRFGRHAFTWHDRTYDRPGDAIHLVVPSPRAPSRFLLLIAGNSPGALSRRGGGLFFGGDDWRITRDGELVRSGVFAQDPKSPWRYDPALDHDRERDRERFTRSLAPLAGAGLVVEAPPGAPGAAAALARGEALLGRLDREGLADPRRRRVTLTLYRSLEEKGILTRRTAPEDLDAGGARAALPAGHDAYDLWPVAAARLVALGASRESPWLEPAAVALARRTGGEPLAAAVSRLYFARLLPTAEDAAARAPTWRSPLLYLPARALVVRAILDRAPRGRAGRRALLAILGAGAPGTLDSLCRRAGVTGAAISRRYAALADSLARVGQGVAPIRRPEPWRPSDGFMSGVCLAHSVSLDRGYLSASCARELARLHGLGAEWVSLTPFGYLPDPHTPEIAPSAEGGPDEETDEAIAEAAGRAHALGMKVWLSPHLWTRGWVGDLDFGPGGWGRFFERYRMFVLHYAVLAEREGMDGLVVGHELESATLGHPERWRALIGEVRRVYSGTLSYDANWGDEVQGVAFWDALDLIGVSFYPPLATEPTRSVRRLEEGAAGALGRLRAVGLRWHRPVLLSEVGYAPFPGAPVHPWEERRTPHPDLETQRACYEALVRALDGEDWVAGAFFWKWFTSPAVGGPHDSGYSPRGKPAEAVVRRAFGDWARRRVHVPRPGG